MVILAMGVVTNGLLARGLGVSDFGVFIAIQTFGTMIAGVLSVGLWAAVVKFGAEAIEVGSRGQLRKIVVVGFLMDTGMALVAVICCVALARWAAGYFGLEARYISLIWTYSLSLLFTGTSSATGLLRLKKRFELVAMAQVAGAFVALVASVLLFSLSMGLAAYVYAFAVVNALRGLFVIATAYFFNRDVFAPIEGHDDFESWRAVAQRLWRFGRVTWVSSIVSSLRSDADIFILGGVLGASEIGIYAATKRLAAPVGRLAQQVRVVVFSEYAEILAGRDQRKDEWKTGSRLLTLVTQVNLVIVVAAVAAAWAFGGFLIETIYGAEFLPGYGVFVPLIGFYALAFVGGNLTSFLINRDGPVSTMWASLGALAMSSSVMLLLTEQLGLTAAAVGNIVGALVIVTTCVVLLRRELGLVRK